MVSLRTILRTIRAYWSKRWVAPPVLFRTNYYSIESLHGVTAIILTYHPHHAKLQVWPMVSLLNLSFKNLTTLLSPSKSTTWFCLILMDSVLHSIHVAQRIVACSHVYQIHQTPPAAFDGFSTPQYSSANRACSHVYQIHQTPPAAFDGFSTPRYSPANRACSHVYQIHQTPPAAFDGFSTPWYSPANRACSHVY